MKKLVLLDGHSVLNRAFYGITNLTTTDGFPTNAIYGFLNIMFKIIEDEKPEYLAVAFDVHAPTFRHNMYDAYKGTRKKPADEFLVQVPKMKEVLLSMGIPVYEMAGYEADDVIGTIAKKAQADGYEVAIVSGDRDLLQLVDEHITVKLAKPQRGNSTYDDYDIAAVVDKYELEPIQIIELKALMGDSSDNIPGLPGVGEKTATAILKKYHTIENAFDNVEDITPPKAQKAFLEHFDMARLSKNLATICIEAPVTPDYEKMKVEGYFNDNSYNLFKNLEMKRFLNKFNEVTSDEELSVEYTITDSEKVLGILNKTKEDEIIGVSLNKNLLATVFDGKVYIIDNNIEFTLSLMLNRFKCITSFTARNIIKTLGLKIYDGVLFDSEVAAYLLNPIKNSYCYDDIARDYLGCNVKNSSEILNNDNNGEGTLKILAYEAYVSAASYEKLISELKSTNMLDLFYDIEMPLVFSLSCMEQEGILVKANELEAYSKDLELKIEDLKQKIHKEAGEEFNINSPKQLGDILFEKLKLPASKKTKSGYSTSVEVLEKLKNQHEIVADVLEYRQLAKFKSTYTDALPGFVAEDGRIHSDFLQTVTATGRISSANPNLQNIPVRTQLGRSIRKVFVPKEGFKFVDADYSQIELRVLAHMSQDENLIEAFLEGNDIHASTAAKVFDVPIEMVTKEQRSSAKAVNFGIVYGISSYGLSQDLNISVKEAKKYIDQYFETYPRVKEFLDKTVAQTKENGYSFTIFNRRRPVPEIKASNAIQRGFGERIAMNSPIQGTAADIMKIAMNLVHKELSDRNLESKIVLQVHDELLVEAKIQEVDIVKDILKNKMEDACQLLVPLLVEVETGDSWYETK